MLSYCLYGLTAFVAASILTEHTRVQRLKSHMQDKQKVTLYLSPKLHRQLKVRAAVELEPMSSIVARAVMFYLAHPALVDELESSPHGRTHQVYTCPDCSTSVVLRDAELVSLHNIPPGVVAETDESLSVKQVCKSSSAQQGEEELVPC